MNTIRVCVSINNKDFLFFDTIIFDNIFCFFISLGFVCHARLRENYPSMNMI